jgi:hypothetical protein
LDTKTIRNPNIPRREGLAVQLARAAELAKREAEALIRGDRRVACGKELGRRGEAGSLGLGDHEAPGAQVAAGRHELGRAEAALQKFGHTEIGRLELSRAEAGHLELGRSKATCLEGRRTEADCLELGYIEADSLELGRTKTACLELGRAEAALF